MTDGHRTTTSPRPIESGFGPVDLHLFGEGQHERIWEKLGAHSVDGGVRFAVWAPNATGVSVVGDFNSWDGRVNPLVPVQSSGIWEGVVPDVDDGACYKYEIHTRDGALLLKADPYAMWAEEPPRSASRVFTSHHTWADGQWIADRAGVNPLRRPLSIYEVHLGSWRHPASYRALAPQLAESGRVVGFTHV